MIQVEVNGAMRSIDIPSIDALKAYLQGATPAGHVICALHVNGLEVGPARLDEFEVDSIQSIAISTEDPAKLAHDSLGETQEWIGRICGVLDSIAQDYRLGREKEGTDRLVSVLDALQVLVGLLRGIQGSITLDPVTQSEVEGPWKNAETELQGSIQGLMQDIESGDPVRLADRTGYTLPRSLDRFRDVLAQIQA